MRKFAASSLLVFAAFIAGAALVRADERGRVRTELLSQMRTLAAQTKVTLDGRSEPAELVKDPVFRYDDQPRRFIDATMWIWTDGGRPIACQKIEARRHFNTNEPLWGYCFTSLCADPIAARWSEDRHWRAAEAGTRFQPVPSAAAVGTTVAARRRQAREIARGFACRMLVNPRTEETAEMRLLTTPIYEYSEAETKLLLGAVFGFEVNGTNPDLLVLIEVQGEGERSAWHFAPARLTTGGITLKYAERIVWEARFVEPKTGPYANWLFFSSPRTPVAGEVQP